MYATENRILGFKLGTDSLGRLMDDTAEAIAASGKQVVFACANPHSLVVATNDPPFAHALRRSTHLVADGVGISALAWLIGADVGARITGGDYFMAVMAMLQKRGGGRVLFFGSTRHVLDKIAARAARDFPLVEICGLISPSFGAWSREQNALFIREINDARPDVLWVGMTAPKQEKWVEANRSSLDVPIIGSIGAVFDFYAGTHPRAPEVLRKAGLEWAYRLVREPRRMWKRNFVSSPLFVAYSIWAHIFGMPAETDQLVDAAGTVGVGQNQLSA